MKKITSVLLVWGLSFLLSTSGCYAVGQDYWKGEDYFKNSSSQKEAANDLIKYVPLKGNEQILDVGCGDGRLQQKSQKVFLKALLLV